jgi:hypothetical protein
MINAIDPATLIVRYANAKRNFYNGIVAARPNQKKFINGWLNRVADVQKNATTMI